MASQITFDILARDRASKTFDKVGGHAGKLGGKLAGIGKAAAVSGVAAAAVGVALLGKAMVNGVKDAARYQDLQNRTKNVLRTTGNAARTSVKAIQAHASALETLSGVDEELIINSQNVLLTFTKIRNEAGKGNRIFDQATKVALDMSTALGTDLQGASIQVGKALNDPIKGVTALQRVGVSFTASQKKQIKTLVESGKTLDAQKLILKELNREFGGAAKAAGKGFNGSMARVKDIIGDTFRDIGMKLLPVITKLANWFAAKLPVAIDKLYGIGRRLTGWWNGSLHPALSKAGRELLPTVRTSLKMVTDGLGKNGSAWKQVGDFITQKAIPVIVQIAKVQLPMMAARLRLAIEVIKGLWKAGEVAYTILRAAFKGIWTVFSSVIGAIVNGAARAFGWVPGLGPKLKAAAAQFNSFRDSVNRSLNGIKNKRINVSAPGASKVMQQLADIRWQAQHIPRSVTIGVANKLHGMRAAGGPIQAGKTYLVGEQGPELVTPTRSGYVHPNGAGVAAGGGGVVVNINGALDPLAVGKQVEAALLRLKVANKRLAFL